MFILLLPAGWRFSRHVSLLTAATLCILFAAGCGRPDEHAQRYELKGKVVSVDRHKNEVVIDHREIPGFMEAMTMPFTLKHEDAFNVLATGDDIQATLVVADSGAWLEDPVITKSAPQDGSTTTGVVSSEPQEGAPVPDFSLVNQDGKRIGLQKYRGRALLVTFIYTRCPLPDYCPLMSMNFAEVNRRLAGDDALGAKVSLLSVTVDPDYDTPEVLRNYGSVYIEKGGEELFKRWEFATGDSREIKRTAEFLGLTYYPEREQIIHSLRTALITPDGRLFKIYRGNDWKPSEVLRDLKSLVS